MIWRSASLWAFVGIEFTTGSAHIIATVAFCRERKDFQWRCSGKVLVLALVTIVGHLLEKK